ncbi:CHK domain-containing protein [Fusarium keratoplasticum]|uniref:CHK domain-containing protein n=1 Tax=Fusarium keratoplasticum TaxID=1328300 RepID=A0ACC0QRP2_9HYPO|nr:CHK domain-containing protein [Fusarium keratoplasticum]KAI8663760.1 CHK domain-containing protein [Fusarium keratoplasticum]
MAALANGISHQVRGAMESSDPLPLTVEELTASWFTKILGKPVHDARVVEAIHGTASKILLELIFEDSANVPIRVCVKGGFNPALTGIPYMLAVYRLEAEFYYHVAPTIKMPLPPTLYSGTDTVNGQGIVVMADLKSRGKPEDILWASQTVSLRDAILGLAAPEAWETQFSGEARPPVPDHMLDRERMTAAFQALWKPSNSTLNCLVHGDAHIGNTFISPTGEPGFLDWQVIHTGSVMHDVSYFIIGALSIEDRRKNEKKLLQSYLDALSHAGGPRLQSEEVWDEYRKHTFHGFAWALATPMMQSREIVHAMTERHCAAIVDHESVKLLEATEE